MKLDGKNIEVKSCPCCGSEMLHVGVMSAQSMGVECVKCSLKMARWIPDRWPPKVWIDGQSVNKNLRRLEVWTLLRAVKAWNKRKKGPL